MGRNNRKKRKIFLLFIVILITTVVLIVETYAWFVGLSTVNTNSFNISISSGSGLEISMDGEHWHKDDDVLIVNAQTIAGTSTVSGETNSNAYSGNTNSWVDSNGLVPISSSGILDTSTGRLNFFEKSSLSSTPGGYKLIADPVDHSSGEAKSYVAFDIFIRNGTDNVYDNSNYDDVAAENIYLKYTSSANVNGTTGYGAANSLRVGFFEIAGMKSYGASTADIRGLSCSTSTAGVKRKLCPASGANNGVYWNVWEPNHTLHTEAVSNYFNSVCKRRNSSGYLTTPCSALSSTTKTYPIKTAITSEDNVDIYDGLNNYNDNIYGNNAKLSPLVTYKTPGSADAYTELSQLFKLAGNSITRVRVYVWLEGQDPDNYDIITKDNNVSVKFGFTKDRYDLESQYTYTTVTSAINVNTDISSFTKYSTFEEATTAYGHKAAMAHEIENGKVKASYVAFKSNGHVYYLKGRINETNASEKTVYNQNVATLKEAFGPNWQSVCVDNSSAFLCNDKIVVRMDGYVHILYGSASCVIDNGGNARCVN